ncbi:MAG: hypothetical protein L0Y36_03505 [Planctomycetales bacterium]|nr:hypothetical protein [Planctomycetales bacterium]
MPIRREDKEFIQSLSLFGALFGACMGVFAVVRLSDRAHQTYAKQTQTHQEQAALLKLSDTLLKPSVEPIIDKEVLTRVQDQMPQTEDKIVPVKSFWLDLPRWGYWGLCAGGCLAGVFAGYGTVWATGWAGSIFIYYFIRLLYKGIRKTTPHLAAAQQVGANGSFSPSYGMPHHRDDTRLLPTIVKLSFLLLFVLGILAAVVWRLTAP